MNRSNTGSLPSVEELMEQYAALVWKTAAAYLKNPEDIKECVNDTFLEFYLHSDRYDPKKGSYAAFLCTIARRKAVSIYRKNRKGSGFSLLSGEREGRAATAAPADMAEPEDMADPADMEEAVAGRLDLEAALQSLKPEEFDIIRMKYYDGMTIKEIANSLNLSYETVKKRHQRSLTKLQKALTIGLILALIAALAACAYVVLRYFGIVPGYGVNTDEEVPFYQLDTAELKSMPADGSSLEILEARYMNGVLYIDVHLSADNPEIIAESVQLSVSCGGLKPEYQRPSGMEFASGTSQGTMGSSSMLEDGSFLHQFEVYFPELEELLKEEETTLDAVFSVTEYVSGETQVTEDGFSYERHLPWHSYELSYTLSLKPLSEDSLEQYSYSMTEDGGLLLMPRLENGELLVDIYPLDPEDGQIVPALLYCLMQNPEETGVITATAEDGTVLEGTCPGYNPFSSDTYFTWNFGPAEPGSYTLEVPYLLKKYLIQEDIRIPLCLEEGYAPDTEYQTSAGTLSIGPLERYDLQPDEIIASDGSPLLDFSETDFYWLLPVNLTPLHPDEEFVFAPFSLSCLDVVSYSDSLMLSTADMDTLRYASGNLLPILIRVRNQTGSDTQPELTELVLYLASQPYGLSSASTDTIYTRWNHSFSIPFTVKESAESLPAARQE